MRNSQQPLHFPELGGKNRLKSSSPSAGSVWLARLTAGLVAGLAGVLLVGAVIHVNRLEGESNRIFLAGLAAAAAAVFIGVVALMVLAGMLESQRRTQLNLQRMLTWQRRTFENIESALRPPKEDERPHIPPMPEIEQQSKSASPEANLHFDQIVQLLQEISANSLLDDDARQAKRQTIEAEIVEKTTEQIDALLEEQEFARADRIVADLANRFPSSSALDALRRRIQDAREQVETRAIQAATRRVEDLMGLAAFSQAIGATEELIAEFPDHPDATGLLERVRREEKLYHEDNRKNLYRRIKQATARREWQDALISAKNLLEQYPDSIEADSLRTQMDTLEVNVEIAERQRLEDEIKDLIRRQRYSEALTKAEQVIFTYPGSPQAQALEEQLPRLKEKASDDADTSDKVISDE